MDYTATSFKRRFGYGHNFILGIFGDVSPFVRLKKYDPETRIDVYVSYGAEADFKVANQINMILNFGWSQFPEYSESCSHGTMQCSYSKSFEKFLALNIGVKYKLKSSNKLP